MPDKDLTITEPKLTLKQKKFLKLYFETGNGTKAAMESYDCKDYGSAGEIASQNLRKLKNVVKTYMEVKGLSLGDLVETVKEARLATKPIGALVLIKKDKDQTVVLKDNEGMIEVADHPTRLKAVEIASKWLGVESNSNQPPEGLKRKLTVEEWISEET